MNDECHDKSGLTYVCVFFFVFVLFCFVFLFFVFVCFFLTLSTRLFVCNS